VDTSAKGLRWGEHLRFEQLPGGAGSWIAMRKGLGRKQRLQDTAPKSHAVLRTNRKMLKGYY
jgi:hypothetical protein